MTNSTFLYSLPYKPEDIKNMTPGEKRKFGIDKKCCASTFGEYDHNDNDTYTNDYQIGRDC